MSKFKHAPADYRRVFQTNLTELLRYHGLNRKTLKAVYAKGSKRGKFVSPRAVGYLLAPALDDVSSPSLDMIAAIAAVFDLLPWQMLFPALDPANPPVMHVSIAEEQLTARLSKSRTTLPHAEHERARPSRRSTDSVE